MPAVIVNKSVIPPTTGGTNAPPDTAIIIRPEISLARSGYAFTVAVKMSGKMLEAARPMENIRAIEHVTFPDSFLQYSNRNGKDKEPGKHGQ